MDAAPTQRGREINNSKVGVFVELESESAHLVVAFAGNRQSLLMPPFEFFRLTDTLATNRILLRDTERAYYQRGVVGAGESIDQVAAYLKAALERIEHKTSVFVGTSSGGYAALLFGHLCRPSFVHAIVPQTVVGAHAAVPAEYQSGSELDGAGLDSRYADLAPIFSRSARRDIEFHIHYGEQNEKDRFHAERLATPRVQLHPYPTARHNCARYLREKGLLQTLLRTYPPADPKPGPGELR